MNRDIDYYKALLSELFGEDQVDCASGKSNNVTGAINWPSNDFANFKRLFRERMERLNMASAGNTALRAAIVRAANTLGGVNNWNGAYAELAALDFMLSVVNINPLAISPDHHSPAVDTLANELGMQDVDHDIYVCDLEAFLDVKVLSDKGEEILESVVKEAKRNLGIQKLQVLFFKPEGISYVELQNKRRVLVDGLTTALRSKERILSIESRAVEGVTFKPVWKGGAYFGESMYEPSAHGREHHVLMFQHAKKFHRTKPSFIIFVNHPWYGQNLSVFPETMTEFTTAFSDAFFTGYIGSRHLAKDFNNKFKTNITCADVADTLTGILFIDDKIVEPEKNLPLLDAYVRINPRNPSHTQKATELLRHHAKLI